MERLLVYKPSLEATEAQMIYRNLLRIFESQSLINTVSYTGPLFYIE